MAICEFCGKEMLGASSCIESYIVINGKKYLPIPYKKKRNMVFGEKETRCPECHVQEGGFHHVGCGLEICPVCQNHWIYCRCHGIKIKKDEDSDKKGRIIPFRKLRL